MQKLLFRLIVFVGLSAAFLPIHTHAQWVQTSGPYGGLIRSIVPSGADLYATTSMEIFLSTDSGARWQALQGPGKFYPSVAVMDSKLFAITNRDGVFLSTDKGASWAQVNTTLKPQTNGASVLVSGERLFVGTSKGVFLSTDYGVNWTAGINPVLEASRVSILKQSGNTLFAGTGTKGVFVSTDKGTNWSAANSGLTTTTVWSMTVLGTNIFAMTDSGVFRSTNSGTDWSADRTLPAKTGSLTAVGTKYLATTPSGLFSSSDNGTSWLQVSTLAIYGLSVSGSNIFGTKGPDILRSSDDGATWESATAGINRLSINLNGVVASGANIVVGTNDHVYHSTNNAETWSNLNTGLTDSYTHALTFNGSDLLAGTNGGMFVSTDVGSTWRAINTGLADSVNGIGAIYASGPNLLAAPFSSTVYYSTNAGATWSLANGLSQRVFSFTKMGTALFAGTQNGNGIYHSTDQGANWAQIGTGLSQGTVYSITAMGDILFAGFGPNQASIDQSVDGGATWKEIARLPGATYVKQLLAKENYLFAATDNGVYLSTDRGTTWSTTNFGKYPNGVDINVNALTLSGTYLLAGTDGMGLWRRDLSDFTSSAVTLTNISIREPFPNPTRGDVKLEGITNGGIVTVSNLFGERVLMHTLDASTSGGATINLGQLPAGAYLVSYPQNGATTSRIIVKEQ